MSPIISPSGGSGSQPIQQTTHSFATAQLRSLFTDSPVTLIAAPGSGKMLIPLALRAVYAAGAHPFFSASGSGSNASFSIGSASLYFLRDQNNTQSIYSLADSVAQTSVPYLNFLVSLVDIIAFSGNRIVRADAVNQPFTLASVNANLTNGEVTSSTINAAGSGYAAGDTLADDGAWGAADLLVTVNTVDGSGHVLTYTMTNKGTSGWASGQTIGFVNVAPQSGAGTGFQLTAGITPGDGTLRFTIDYEVLTLA